MTEPLAAPVAQHQRPLRVLIPRQWPQAERPQEAAAVEQVGEQRREQDNAEECRQVLLQQARLKRERPARHQVEAAAVDQPLRLCQ